MDADRRDRGAHGLPVAGGRRPGPRRATWQGRAGGQPGPRRVLQLLPGQEPRAPSATRGMVTSTDAEWLAAAVRQMATTAAATNRYDNVVLGTNSRLDALQAAILRVKLRHLDAWNEERRARVRAYDEALAGCPAWSARGREAGGALGLAPLHHPRRRARRAAEAPGSHGIATAVHYPRPIHLQPAMAAAGASRATCPVSERAVARGAVPAPLPGAAPRGGETHRR